MPKYYIFSCDIAAVSEDDRVCVPMQFEKELVHCSECAVPHNKWTGCPKLNGLVTPPDFYCGFGYKEDKEHG